MPGVSPHCAQGRPLHRCPVSLQAHFGYRVDGHGDTATAAAAAVADYDDAAAVVVEFPVVDSVDSDSDVAVAAAVVDEDVDQCFQEGYF